MEEKSKLELAQEARRFQLSQVRNLSDVYGFPVTANGSGKCIILFGQKRRWGNSYKRFAVTVHTDDLLKSLMQILGSGGKVFGVQ